MNKGLKEKNSFEENREEKFFEMDLTARLEIRNELEITKTTIHKDKEELKGPPKKFLPNKASLSQGVRQRSYSIPNKHYSKTLQVTSSDYNRSPILARPRLNSSGSVRETITPLSLSPSFIPRKLRASFSKLLPRKSFSWSKTPDKDQGCLNLDINDSKERRHSNCTCSIVCPATEEVVKESLEQGLPIIPFAYPTFFIASKKQEDVKDGIRKNSLRRMKQSFSGERDSEGEQDKSLRCIVRKAQEEIKRKEKVPIILFI